MKIKGLDFLFGKIRHTYPMTEDKYRFLVVDTGDVRSYFGSLSNYECCHANEFYKEEDAIKYVDEQIPKAHRNRVRIYKEIP